MSWLALGDNPYNRLPAHTKNIISKKDTGTVKLMDEYALSPNRMWLVLSTSFWSTKWHWQSPTEQKIHKETNCSIDIFELSQIELYKYQAQCGKCI